MKRSRISFLLGLAITALILSLFLIKSRPIDAFEEKLWDLRFKLRGPVPAPETVVIVAIDEQSIEKIGRWPWDREYIARLINIISANDPKVIALDIIFSEPSKSDFVLERAFENAGNVILPMAFIFDDGKHGPLQLPSNDHVADHSFPIVRGSQQALHNSTQPYQASGVLLPVESFSSVADLGQINVRPDDDGTLRFETLAIEYGGNYYPSFSLKIAQVAMGVGRGNLVYDAGRTIQLAETEIPVDILGRTPIFYYGPENTFPTYSIVDLLEGKISPNKLKEKIVLIGATALGIGDMKVTPLSVSMPGVEKHGHVAASFMEGRLLNKVSSVADLLILACIGLPLSFGLARMKALVGTIVSLLALAAFLSIGYLLFTQNGTVINMAYPTTEIFSLYVGITAYRYASEEREAKKIKKMFDSYVTERVVNELIKNPDMAKLGGSRREVTILFSDIRGFTSFSESRPPEEVVNQLNEYLGAMTEVVFKHNGTLDKFIGDAIMAFWGAPLKQENHVELAVRCALNMVDRLTDLQKKWQSEGKESFGLGIGLNTGEVLVGNIGIEGKKIDYTVIGDHVNLASRVESLTRSYNADILLTEFTYKCAKELVAQSIGGAAKRANAGKDGHSQIGHAVFSEADRVKVKGKAQSVTIYKLESLPHKEGDAQT